MAPILQSEENPRNNGIRATLAKHTKPLCCSATPAGNGRLLQDASMVWEKPMPQIIALAIGFAAGAFAWSGDPIVAFLMATFALVWIASTSLRARQDRMPSSKPTFLVRPE
jgi:hypothetical protein